MVTGRSHARTPEVADSRARRPRARMVSGLAAIACLVLWAGPSRAETDAWQKVIEAGVRAHERGEYAEAVKMFTSALEDAQASEAREARLVASLVHLASVYLRLHQYSKAEPALSRAIPLQEALAGPRHPSVAALLEDYAWVLRLLGREQEALRVESRIREIRARPVLYEPEGRWVKAGAALQDFDRAYDQCLREARTGATTFGYLVDPDRHARCLEAQGWRFDTLKPRSEALP